jgi:glucose-6-phosphate isomerase
MKDILPRFNWANLLERVAGPEHGLTKADVDGLFASIPGTHAKIEEMRAQGKADWMNLHLDPGAEAVIASARDMSKACKDFVVLGIGGSALGPSAVIRALGGPHLELLKPAKGKPRVIVEDNIDPARMTSLLERADLKNALFNVITKSGATPETMAQFLIVRDALVKAFGPKWKDRVVVTTDPKKGALRAIADKEGLKSFLVPPGAGGRYSVLCAVGLVPIAAAGYDAAGLLRGATAADEKARSDPARFAGYVIGGMSQLLGSLKRKPILVMFCYSDSLGGIADWFRQLWAESLGKRLDNSGREVFAGTTPVMAIGTTDQHSQVQLYTEGPNDKAFMFLSAGGGPDIAIPASGYGREELEYLEGRTLGALFKAEMTGTIDSLNRARRPSATITLPSIDAETVGALLYSLELATFFAGVRLNVNPFDQPGVEHGKQIAAALMGKPGMEAKRREVEEAAKAAAGFEI